VLDALIDRQDRQIAGTIQTTVVKQPLQVTHHHRRTVGYGHHAVDKISAGQVHLVTRDAGAGVAQQRLSLGAKQALDGVGHGVPSLISADT